MLSFGNFLNQGESFGIKNYNIIRYDRRTRSGGVAILIQKHIKYKDLQIVNRYESIEVCGCEVFTATGPLTVLSVYLPSNLNLSLTHLNYLLTNLNFSSLFIMRIMCVGVVGT